MRILQREGLVEAEREQAVQERKCLLKSNARQEDIVEDEHESKSASICSSSTSGRTTSKEPSTSKEPKERTRPLVHILQQEGLLETEHERAVQDHTCLLACNARQENHVEAKHESKSASVSSYATSGEETTEETSKSKASRSAHLLVRGLRREGLIETERARAFQERERLLACDLRREDHVEAEYDGPVKNARIQEATSSEWIS